MAPNRIMRGRLVRRALLLGAITTVIASSLGACGGGGSATPPQEKEADVGVLNEVLGRQLAAIEAYAEVLPKLRGADLAAAREFRAQEQEHADATTRVLRKIGGEADPPAETIEAKGLKTRHDALTFLYEMESATIDAELSAVGKLHIPWPRPQLAAMVANQAQRLALIRRALGADPLETVPDAFETGETPAPEGMMEKP
ncbi:MAG: ferritin-like domain-containing protein [Solirubrobacterales bacterium]